MNRLILLGNGFDLAHGMKTSYNDFILWYIKHVYTRCFKEDGYRDQLIGIQKRNFGSYELTEKGIEERIDQLFSDSKLHLIASSQGLEYYANGSSHQLFQVDFCSDLLANLLTYCTGANWVDIENEFYKELTNILRAKHGSSRNLNMLNDALADLINHLQTYLDSLKPAPYLPAYEDILSSEIEVKDFPDKFAPDKNAAPEETMILNFNYTSTVEQYIKKFHLITTQSRTSVNNIHGRINAKDNPIVFGFGDELDMMYAEMEQQSLNGFFKYTKSFWYSTALNYRSLLNFIRSGPYQIFIVGQSCGLSDRTLLSMLFGNTECKSVKIFYYGNKEQNNFTDITHQLGRQFKDKDRMREVIVPFPLCGRMPQHND